MCIRDRANIVDVSYMYIDMGFPEKALTWLTRGREKYAEEEAYLAVTGDCYYAQGLVEKATFVFNKLIDKNPYSAPYWFGPVSYTHLSNRSGGSAGAGR